MNLKKKLLIASTIVFIIFLAIIVIILISTKDDNQVSQDSGEVEEVAEKRIDDVSPIIILDDVYIVKTGYNKNLVDVIMSADDVDPSPEREIIGEYDLNVAGEYELTYKIVDNSGNETTKDFTLKVRDEQSSYKENDILFEDAISTYKNENAILGIDVSKWQEEIDWEKVANQGVEFAIIRMGYQNGFDGEVLVDPYFEQNINGCEENNIPVAIYFSSYAKTSEEAREQAKWVKENLDAKYNNLSVSFDWENWSSFNKLEISLNDINDIADSFMDTCKLFGYEPMLYGSKTYLEEVWKNSNNYPVWLANYATITTYDKPYKIWQLCQTGKIEGISGYVDINVMYK